MTVTSIITTARELELKLQVPQNVFKPSFMTAELLKSFSLVSNLQTSSKILDLGTGCGIIALSLHLVGFTNIYVSDKFSSALKASKQNFQTYKFTPKRIYQADMFNGIDEKFDLIITNPPAFAFNPGLKKNEGLDGAIYSGNDGRQFMTSFLAKVSDYLTPDGHFLMTAPSFLDWTKVDKLLRLNSIEYTHIISDKCTLPTYGYPVHQFIKNFEDTFSSNYYDDGNFSQEHHWKSFDKKIEYRVKTICGKPSTSI